MADQVTPTVGKTPEQIERDMDQTRESLTEKVTALESQVVGTVQTAADIASRLVDMELYGLPEDYFDRYRENIAAVTKDEITRVANKYLDPDRMLIVVVGNAKDIREPLGTLGMPVHDLDIDGNMLPVA